MNQALGSRYVLREQLGRGGMGTVYRASCRDDGDDRAIKLLRQDLVDDPVLVARFVQERGIVMGLRSPHLVEVRDLVVEGDVLAIVMDLVPGCDLRRYLRERGVLNASAALELTRQILSGLAAVHGAGIVHRDLKPENVMLDLVEPDRPVAKVTDFGIARIADGPHLTRLTGYLGTPEYMAPELGDGDHGSYSCDVYAVGIMLYELVSGRTPYAGGGALTTLRRHAEAQPERPANVPDALWMLIERMIAKRSADRPADARTALAELASVAPLIQGQRVTEPDPTGSLRGPFAPPPGAAAESLITLSAESPAHTQIRPTPVPAAVPEPKRGWFRRLTRTTRGKLAVVSVVLLVIVLAAGGIASLFGRGTSKPVTLPFAAEQYSTSGLSVSRTWTLRGTTLHGELLVLASKGGGATFDEVLPEEMTHSSASVRFSPEPRQIIKADPIVRYSVNLQTGQSATFDYNVPVAKGPATLSRLQSWAGDEAREASAYRASTKLPAPLTVTQLVLSPGRLPLTVGGAVHRLALAGITSERHPAAGRLLTRTVWTSDDPKTATVDQNGTVSPVGAGATYIHATLGAATAKAVVLVTSTANVASVRYVLPDGAIAIASNHQIQIKPALHRPSTVARPVAMPGDSSAMLMWSTPNDGGSRITRYEVRDGTGSLKAVTTETSTMIRGLHNGTAYRFSVVAVNGIGPSLPSPVSAPVTPIILDPPPCLPKAPQRVVAAASETGNVQVLWKPPRSGGCPVMSYTVTTQPASTPISVPASTLATVVPGLQPGDLYEFEVAAVYQAPRPPQIAVSPAITIPEYNVCGTDGCPPPNPPVPPVTDPPLSPSVISPPGVPDCTTDPSAAGCTPTTPTTSPPPPVCDPAVATCDTPSPVDPTTTPPATPDPTTEPPATPDPTSVLPTDSTVNICSSSADDTASPCVPPTEAGNQQAESPSASVDRPTSPLSPQS